MAQASAESAQGGALQVSIDGGRILRQGRHDPPAMSAGDGEKPPARMPDQELLGLANGFVQAVPRLDNADPGFLEQVVGILAGPRA